MEEIVKRKQAHIDLCLQPESQGGGELFADYHLPYRALPELNLRDVQTDTALFGKALSQPLIIASMTGGTKHAAVINTNLAQAAESLKVAMGVGSQRIALEKEDALETFQLVRKYAPTAVIFANMGAVQLNYGRTIDDYRRVVEMIQADGLYLHLNPLQEALQLEGDTDFSGLLNKISQLVKKIGVPVFVKEVGHGIDVKTAEALVASGVAGIDCAGTGGTSWAWVEATRAQNKEFQDWFKEFGYRADELLPKYAKLPVTKVVSGGIRTPVEAVKAGAFGADFYSMAQPFLAPALISAEAVAETIKNFQKGLQITLFSCGCPSWRDATHLELEKV